LCLRDLRTMNAVVIRDGRVWWEERPCPALAAGELLVRVEAAGINRADILQRAGSYPPPPGIAVDMPGLECAGLVEETGAKVAGFREGDLVMALLPGAGQAEMAVVHESLALAVPPGISISEAAGFPEVFCTAHDALFSQASLTTGDRLLVTGAAGGAGLAGVQLGLAAGASVVASARNSSYDQRFSDLGATPARPEDALSLGPFDVVLELVGAESATRALERLAPWGRVVVIGLGAGAIAEFNLGLLMSRRATLRGSTLRTRSHEEKALVVRRAQHHVLPLVASGRLKVFVEETFPFERAQDGYDRFARGGKFGKVVLVR
jgi:NADPH:quinone reductase